LAAAMRRELIVVNPAEGRMDALEALARHRERQADQRLMFGSDYSDHGLVFCLPKRDAVSARNGHASVCQRPSESPRWWSLNVPTFGRVRS
jgi:hypothetical protein